jgi:hypothetical protein
MRGGRWSGVKSEEHNSHPYVEAISPLRLLQRMNREVSR